MAHLQPTHLRPRMCPARPRAWGDRSPGRPYCPGQPFLSAAASPHILVRKGTGDHAPGHLFQQVFGRWQPVADPGFILKIGKEMCKVSAPSGSASIPGLGSALCGPRRGCATAAHAEPRAGTASRARLPERLQEMLQFLLSFTVPQNMAPHLHPWFRGM